MKNILFILADDQRYNTIHALGNKEIKTPTLDWLVKNGTAFTQAHIPSGTSGAVCMPSRAMIHSGRTLFHLSGEGETIPREHITMGENFKNAGYNCFGTGKWHNGPPSFTRSFCGGENAFFGGMWDHWNVPTCKYDETGEYDNVINFTMNFYYNNSKTQINCDKFNPGIHSSELLSNTAIEFVKNRKSSKPFFLYLSYLAPHDPRTMPQEYIDMYSPDDITLPKNVTATHPFDFGVSNIRDEVLTKYPREEDETRKQLAEYYGMISHLDYEIGRVIEQIRQEGELDNTMIVFTGDNGLAVGSHGLMGKQNHYDHSIRVPLIIYDPSNKKAQIVDNYVYLLDIYPTICDMVGVDIPKSVEGKSFMKMFEDPTYKTRNTLFFAYNDVIRSVKNHRYKLIEYRNTIKETQLFDLINDPDEMNDLSKNPEFSSVIVALTKELIEYRNLWEDNGHRYTESFWNSYEKI